MSEIDDYFKKISGGTQNTKSNSGGSSGSVVDDYFNTVKKTIPAPKKVETPPVKKSLPLWGIFGDPGTPIAEMPGYKENKYSETINALPGSIAENLPFGVGDIVKFANEDPESVYNVTFEDVLQGIKDTSKGVFKGIIGAGASLAMTPLKFNVPILGEVTNVQMNAVDRIKNGDDVSKVILEEGVVNNIFGTLMLVGLTAEIAGPRQVTTSKVTLPKDSGVTVKAPPKSFRLYDEPIARQPVTPISAEAMDAVVAKYGLNTGAKYNPELPTYFKMTGKANGNIVAEVVQIKPSYLNTAINWFKSNPVGYNSTQKSLLSSGHDLDRAIESGEVPVEKIYKNTAGQLQPAQATHTVSDLAGKLDFYKKGLGDQFKKVVKIDNPTPTNLIQQASDFLAKQVVGKNVNPVKLPLLTQKEISGIPPEDITPIITKEININEVKKTLATKKNPPTVSENGDMRIENTPTEILPFSEEDITPTETETSIPIDQLQKGQYITATSLTGITATGPIIEVREDGLIIKEPVSGIPMLYKSDKFTFEPTAKIPTEVINIPGIGEVEKLGTMDVKTQKITSTPTSEPIEKTKIKKDDLTTPGGVAKNLNRGYVERGDTIAQLKSGGMGSGSLSGPSAQIGGYLNGKRISNDFIIVERVAGGKKVDTIISLKKTFDAIKAEPKPKQLTKREEQEKRVQEHNKRVEAQGKSEFSDEEIEDALPANKEGTFEDFRNPDLAKTPSEAKAIKERNKKVMNTAMSAFDSDPRYSDLFDNPDAIREVIDDYKQLQQVEKDLLADKKEIKAEVKSSSLGAGEKGSMASAKGERKTIRQIFERMSKEKLDAPQEVPKDFKISERAKDILKEFGIVSGERELPKSLLGVFKPFAKKVRVQAFYDVTTVTHEAIHAIDDQINFTKRLIEDTTQYNEAGNLMRSPIRKQLTDIYENLYATGKRTHKLEKRMEEGLATFFENYFYNPTTTTEQYPGLVDAFIKPTGEYYDPLFAKLLDRMNTLVEDYSKLSPEDKIGSRIRTGKEIVDKQSGFTWKQRIVFEIFNRFEPLKRYAKKAGVTETWDDPMVQAFNILNKNSIVTNWVKGDSTPILLRDGNFRIEKGSVAEYLKLTKGDEKAFRSYLVARRVFEANNNVIALENEKEIAIKNVVANSDLVDILMTDKTTIETDGTTTEKPGLTLQQATLTAELMQKERIIKSFDEKIDKIKSVITNDDFSTQDANAVVEKFSGKFVEAEKIFDNINKRLIDVAEENDLIDFETAETYRSEKGYASFKRFIDDELDSLGTIKTSSKSKVSSFKERTGSQLDIIDPVYNQIMAINEVIGKAMENRLWSKVAGLAGRDPEIAQRFEPMKVEAAVNEKGVVSFPQEKDPNVIRIFVKGKRKFFKASPEFLAISKTLRGKEFDAMVMMLRIPSSVFTRLTTSANPFFAVGNLTVDQFSATTQTKTGYKPILDPAKGLINYISGNEALKAYYAMGGKRQTMASYFDLSPDDIVHSLTGGETKMEKTTGYINSALGVLEWPSNISEIITRFGEYRRSVEQGEPMSVAMYRASEVTTPFQLSGNIGGRLGQEYIKSIPYLNALIQVLYKFGRTTKDNPKRVGSMFAGLLAVGLTTAILTMKNSSEKQKRLLSEQPVRNMSRYIYFPSPNGEDLIKIRIPEQFGIFTGMTYLYTIQHYGGNKATFDDYASVVASAVPEQINFLQPKKALLSYIPQVLKPSVSISANVKTFPDVAPIVPAFVVDRKPSEQYNAYTSKVAKTVGQITNTSPMLIDYWVKNQFGVVGGLFVGKIPTDPINIKENEFVMSGRSYNRFYDNRTIVDQQYQEIKDNPKKYSQKDIIEMTKTHKQYGEVSDMLSDMRKINNVVDIPDDLKSGMYNLLVNFDDSGVQDSSGITILKAKINAYKLRNKIK